MAEIFGSADSTLLSNISWDTSLNPSMTLVVSSTPDSKVTVGPGCAYTTYHQIIITPVIGTILSTTYSGYSNTATSGSATITGTSKYTTGGGVTFIMDGDSSTSIQATFTNATTGATGFDTISFTINNTSTTYVEE